MYISLFMTIAFVYATIHSFQQVNQQEILSNQESTSKNKKKINSAIQNDKDIRNPTSISMQNVSTESRKETEKDQFVSQERKAFFDSALLNNEAAHFYYHDLTGKMAKKKSNQLISEYVAEGLLRDNSLEFAAYMESLMREINLHKEDIYSSIVENEALLQKDPFVYQMTLNLSFNLNLEINQKTRLLGGALSIPFTFDQNGKMSDHSTNITNSLILLKNSKLSQEEIKKYIVMGYNVNSGSERGRAEYMARVQSYYPDFVF